MEILIMQIWINKNLKKCGGKNIGKNRNLEELKFGKMDFQIMQIWKNATLEKCKFEV